MAFVYDADGRFRDNVIAQRIEMSYWEELVLSLLTEHVRPRLQSFFAGDILNNCFGKERFWQIVPKEILTRLRISGQCAGKIAGDKIHLFPRDFFAYR